MHIAVLSDPENFHTQKWSLGLQNAGAKVTIFSFSDYRYDKVPCVQIQPKWGRPDKLSYLSFLRTGKALRKALVEHKVDLINPINITPYGVWADQSGFRPMISIAMGADIFEYPPKRKQFDIPWERTWNQVEVGNRFTRIREFLKWYAFRYYVGRSLKHSDMITGDNLQLVHAVQDWFKIPEQKVRLNRWGIEEELFTTTEAERVALKEKYQVRDWQKVVLSPRGMKPIYQGDIILEAFELLLRRGVRDIKFIMLSAGYEVPDKMRKKAAFLASNFENFHVEFGVLPREEVAKLWSIVDAFISAPVYDGYSNALSEGRYMGAIPLVNAIPANLELIEHDYNGWMVDPFRPQELADAILTLNEDLSSYKSRYASLNRDWIMLNSHLKTNARMFVKLCKRVLKQYQN